jgi:hypothetical protein
MGTHPVLPGARSFAATLLILTAFALVPSPTRAAVEDGHPACDYCRMWLEDPHFGGRISLRTGSRRIYDSIECMAAAVLTDSVPQREIKGIWVADHDGSSSQLPLERAAFVHCPEVASPMGLSLMAFGTRARAEASCPHNHGRVLDWRGVLWQVNNTWFQGRLSVDTHAAVPRAKVAQPKAAPPESTSSKPPR